MRVPSSGVAGSGARGSPIAVGVVVVRTLLRALVLTLVLTVLAPGTGQAAPTRSGETHFGPTHPGETPSDETAPGEAETDVAAASQNPPRSSEEKSAAPKTGERRGSPLTDPELFLRANQAYQEADYGRAIALYRELLERGHDDGHLHYNLGNAYLRDGELGRAIAAYRRSLRRMPRDQDLHANLEFARKSAKDALAPPAPSPWVSTLFFWHFQMSRRELAWSVVILNLLFWGLLGLWLFRRRSELLPWVLGGVLVFLLGSGGSLLVHELWPQRVAVVLPPEIDARSGPGADAVVRFKLHAGSEVAVQDLSEDWVRIAGPDGQQAWVESDQVAVVPW
jgi:hypothetical protein